MPRSFRFDPNQIPSHEPVVAEGGLSTAATPEVHGVTPVHYGRRFSQTARLYHEKAEARSHEPPKMSIPAQAQAHSEPAAKAARRSTPKVSAAPRMPIGALPVTTEPPPEFTEAAPTQGIFRELYAEASRSFELVVHAVHDLRTAADQLAHLPFEAVRKMAGRLEQLRHA